MTARGKKRPALLAQASAYFRLAAKAEKNGQGVQADHYRGIANRKVDQHRRNTEALRKMKGNQ